MPSRNGPVCQGYAPLIYKILKSMDIQSLVINGSDHMWNMVFIEGKWYHIDATYDEYRGDSFSGHRIMEIRIFSREKL